MSSSTAMSCAKCNKPATQACARCKHGLSTEFKATSTHYCSKVCQTQDWPRHKPSCKDAVYRLQLENACTIAEGIFMGVRRDFLFSAVKSVTHKGGGAQLQIRPDSEGSILYDFPEDIAEASKKYDILRGVSLEAWRGRRALSVLYPVLSEALKGCYHEISEVELLIEHGQPANSLVGFTLIETSHRVLKIDLKDGNSYVFDVIMPQGGSGLPLSCLGKWPQFLGILRGSKAVYSKFGTEFKQDERDLDGYKAFRALGWGVPRGVYNLRQIIKLNVNIATAQCVQLFGRDEPRSLSQIMAAKTDDSTHELMKNFGCWMRTYVGWLKADGQKNAKAGDPYSYKTFSMRLTPKAQEFLRQEVATVEAAFIKQSADTGFTTALKARFDDLAGRA